MTETEALLERLRALEDRVEIYELVASYGPAVDSLSGDDVAGSWTEGGSYDAEGVPPFVGRAAVGALVDHPTHQQYVAAGCAHVSSLPRVAIHGDRAVATSYSRLYVAEGDHWRVERVAANRWELARTGEGWRVERRVNRLLDGGPEGPAILADRLTGLSPGSD